MFQKTEKLRNFFCIGTLNSVSNMINIFEENVFCKINTHRDAGAEDYLENQKKV